MEFRNSGSHDATVGCPKRVWFPYSGEEIAISRLGLWHVVAKRCKRSSRRIADGAAKAPIHGLTA
jgi:hypothetical protein